MYGRLERGLGHRSDSPMGSREGGLGSGRHRDGGGSSRQLTPLLILAILGGSPSIQIAPFPSIAPWSRQNNRPMRWVARSSSSPRRRTCHSWLTRPAGGG